MRGRTLCDAIWSANLQTARCFDGLSRIAALCMVDRYTGGKENARRRGLAAQALFTLTEMPQLRDDMLECRRLWSKNDRRIMWHAQTHDRF